MTEPELILYGGKGGVGKTTLAAATALDIAGRGAEVLVVSTDPAHSLSDSFGVPLDGEPREVRPGLWAVEIDPDERLEAYRGMLAALAEELREVGIRLDEEDVDDLFAAGVAPGSDEAAALDVLVDYVDAGRWEYVVLDTAPTGHTLRLLDLPDVMSTAVEKTLAVRGQVRRLADSARRMVLGPAYYLGRAPEEDPDDFVALKGRMERVRDLLCDPGRTEFRVALVPEAMAVRETERLVERLRAAGVPVETLVVNRVLEGIDEGCARCRARRAAQREHVDAVREAYPELEIRVVPEVGPEVHGVDALEAVAERIRV